MDITFLGTGSGKASLKRNHSSFIISSSNYNLLIDSGDGISRAFLQNKIPFDFIDGILLTHLHPDHFSGFAALIVQMKMIDRTKNLDVFVSESLLNVVKDYLTKSYIFEEKLDFRINYKSFKNNEETKIIDNSHFLAKQNSHLKKYEQFDKEKKLSFSSSSFLFNIEEKVLFYTGDIGSKNDLYLFENERIDTMISEITHVEIPEILEVAQRIKINNLILTHISDEDEPGLEKLKYLLKQQNKLVVQIAFDSMKVSL